MDITIIDLRRKIYNWILAARPKTLPAALNPVIVGTSIAIYYDKFHFIAALIALLCSLLFQIGANFTNDLFDYLHGADKKERTGPQRVVASGLISIDEMKTGIIITFGLSFLLGLYLVYLGGWFIFLIGVLSIITAIAYTAGPFPLAYHALGDLAVFIFFGFAGTIGTYYVQAHEFEPLAFWASIPVGALITNILVVNNYRDIEEDKLSNKNTLAVIIGEKLTRLQYLFFVVVSYLILFIVYFLYKKNLIIFLPLLSIPLSIKLIKMIYTLKGKELNKTLELTAKFSIIYGLLFAAGIIL
ncbi:1,4-dihydroxy-2-naphthoate polyprenyltransferase [Rosettibacter firmus]|uniref:1,4-dihydroxy-2-naphthoate polyprenyltransferase n=1 Tax=Rosettibacter firmus TaxID=3111522 RepID=UPI00336C2F35